jgi:hypothetical protein
MNSARYFMRREHYQEPTTPADSPFRKFIVHCLKCGSYRLRLTSAFDDSTGENRVTLTCTKCRQSEGIRLA